MATSCHEIAISLHAQFGIATKIAYVNGPLGNDPILIKQITCLKFNLVCNQPVKVSFVNVILLSSFLEKYEFYKNMLLGNRSLK